MTYTVWMDGTKIGDTALELSPGEGRRAGIFHPTAPGLAVLPGIAAMAPALLDAGRMCRENGIDTEDPENFEGAAEGIFETTEGNRILEAAKLIARLELRGPGGEVVPWESLLISDMNELAALAGGKPGKSRGPAGRGGGDPIRYFISAKLDPAHAGGRRDRKRLTS